MFGLFRKKTRLEKLQCRYTWLMRRSYLMALKDKAKSNELHQRAERLLLEINTLSIQNGDN
jgi:hypothetical protein